MEKSHAAAAGLERIWREEARVEDDWAAIYDKVYDELQPCYRLYKERVVDLVLEHWRGGRILEVGCGTGAVLSRLAQRGVPQTSLVGVDISARMVEAARRKLPLAEFAATPFELYLPASPFRVVYFCGSLHHMPNQRLVADTVSAITTEGASVVVCEPNQRWIFTPVWLNRTARALNPWWLWLRWKNRASIRAIQELISRQEDPAFHVHVESREVDEAFREKFVRVRTQTDFGMTRLFEGVLVDDSAGMGAVRFGDRLLGRMAPASGGSIEMVYERRTR